MNTLEAAAVEGHLAQPAKSKRFWKKYPSFLLISLVLNSLPIDPRTVAKSRKIIGRSQPFCRIKCRLDEIDFYGQRNSQGICCGALKEVSGAV